MLKPLKMTYEYGLGDILVTESRANRKRQAGRYKSIVMGLSQQVEFVKLIDLLSNLFCSPKSRDQKAECWDFKNFLYNID